MKKGCLIAVALFVGLPMMLALFVPRGHETASNVAPVAQSDDAKFNEFCRQVESQEFGRTENKGSLTEGHHFLLLGAIDQAKLKKFCDQFSKTRMTTKMNFFEMTFYDTKDIDLKNPEANKTHIRATYLKTWGAGFKTTTDELNLTGL